MKMLRFLAALVILFTGQPLHADTPELSNNAEISVLTCSPGTEVYSLFGHSAMRVRDPNNGIDVVYNYGTFSMKDELDFTVKFTMGRLYYQLSRSSFEGFLREYQYEERGVVEQVLNLDSTERQTVFNFLDWNHQPENRKYLYDFFFDNCSSILRDVLEKNLDGVAFADLSEPESPTFRDLIDRYLQKAPWLDFGIDVGLGLPCDRVATSREYMFLPDKLHEALASATLHGQPLVSEENRILPEYDHGDAAAWSNPTPLMWLIFALLSVVTLIGWKYQIRMRIIDALLFLIVGAVGALVFFLWFISDHTATVNNLNMLWAWPTHLIAIPLVFTKRRARAYFKVYGLVLAATLLLFFAWPQDLHPATIPIMLLLTLRSWFNIKLES